MSRIDFRPLSLALLVPLALAAPGLAARWAPRSAPPQAGIVVCDRYVGAEYSNGSLGVACTPEGGGASRIYRVTTNPSPAEVLAFVNPYELTVHAVSVEPWTRGTPPIQNFKKRIMLGYDETGRITRVRYQNVN